LETAVNDKEPINMATGEYYFFMDLLNVRGGILPLNFRLFYGSHYNQVATSSLPYRFNGNHYVRLSKWDLEGGDTMIIVALGLGYEIVFGKTETGWEVTDIKRVRYKLIEKTDYFYMLDPVQELVYIFKKQPLGYDLVRKEDRNGNALTYEGPAAGLPVRIYDEFGRELRFTYQNFLWQKDGTNYINTYLTRVEDQNTRSWVFTYGWDENEIIPWGLDNAYILQSLTDPMENVTTFTYGGRKRMVSKTLPGLNVPYTNMYYPDYGVGVVQAQVDAYGNTTQVQLDQCDPFTLAESQFTVTYADGSQRVFVHDHNARVVKSITDPTGKIAQFQSPAVQDQIGGVTDRMGDTASITYHTETGKIVSFKNTDGKTITYTYTAKEQTFTNPLNDEQVSFTFYDLTRIDYPDGTHVEFTYDGKGNVLTYKDQAGKTWTYEYNNRGQVAKITNPNGGTVEYTYNNDATLASSKDSDTGTTTYGYDTYKRLNRITHPNPTFIQIAYNLNDQITSITDENNHTYTFQYDANGNLTRVTDPMNQTNQFGYDLMDRVNQLTNRLGKQWSRTYDNMERLASITDPNGVQSSFGYNTRGWMERVTLGGQNWQIGYDDEGVPTSSTTPLGYVTTYQNDKLGYLSVLTNPLGQTTTINRDSMSRMTGVTDALNRTTAYTYDNRGLLSGVTLPVIGTATYARNDVGLLSQITDLKGSKWTFDYTDAGRPQSETDPLGNMWQYGYDSRGRPTTTIYPGGETATPTYDAAGNIVRLLYSGGPDLQSTYDNLNRLLTANNLSLTRDVEGRVTNTENPGTNFGATYDDGGRLKTVTYPSTGSGQDLFTVTYSYDATTGLLSRVTDNLTNTQIDFTYDSDRRLTGTTRSNGVNTTFTWDNASRLTRIQDGPSTGSGIIDLQYTLDAAGQVSQAKMTVPLDPSGLLEVGTDNFSYDAASQVSTSGYTYDQRGRLSATPNDTLTWDGASRLIGISSKPVTLSYNGLGDLMARTEDGKTIHYYYNYAIGLTPIVAESLETGGNGDTATRRRKEEQMSPTASPGQPLSASEFKRYYVWTPGGSLLYMIDVQNGNKVYFYHFDRTGSTLALTDSTGTVTDKYAYGPYGGLLGHQGSNTQPFTFVGKWGVRQEGAGGSLYHMRARYYDAVTQRFISREPLWPLINDPLQLNPFAYAKANPIIWVDVTGRFQDPLGLHLLTRTQVELLRAADFASKYLHYMGKTYDLPLLSREWQANAQLARAPTGAGALFASLVVNYFLWEGVGQVLQPDEEGHILADVQGIGERVQRSIEERVKREEAEKREWERQLQAREQAEKEKWERIRKEWEGAGLSEKQFLQMWGWLTDNFMYGREGWEQEKQFWLEFAKIKPKPQPARETPNKWLQQLLSTTGWW